jgi:hypothetical protein
LFVSSSQEEFVSHQMKVRHSVKTHLRFRSPMFRSPMFRSPMFRSPMFRSPMFRTIMAQSMNRGHSSAVLCRQYSADHRSALPVMNVASVLPVMNVALVLWETAAPNPSSECSGLSPGSGNEFATM